MGDVTSVTSHAVALLLPESQSTIDKYMYDVIHEVIREVIHHEVSHEVIRVAVTSKFTAFKQRSWRMKIDLGVSITIDNASLNLFTAAPNLVKRPQLQGRT